MIALLLAAQLSAAVAPPRTAPTPSAFPNQNGGCADVLRQVTEDQQEALKRLDRQLPAVAQYAVDRKVAGCRVPTPVGYHAPAAPKAPDRPAMREDAPANTP